MRAPTASAAERDPRRLGIERLHAAVAARGKAERRPAHAHALSEPRVVGMEDDPVLSHHAPPRSW